MTKNGKTLHHPQVALPKLMAMEPMTPAGTASVLGGRLCKLIYFSPLLLKALRIGTSLTHILVCDRFLRSDGVHKHDVKVASSVRMCKRVEYSKRLWPLQRYFRVSCVTYTYFSVGSYRCCKKSTTSRAPGNTATPAAPAKAKNSLVATATKSKAYLRACLHVKRI